MKLTIANKQVVAAAETAEESFALIRLAHSEEAKPTQKKVAATKRRRQTIKMCPICNRGYRGLKLHTTRAHGDTNWNHQGKIEVVPVN